MTEDYFKKNPLKFSRRKTLVIAYKVDDKWFPVKLQETNKGTTPAGSTWRKTITLQGEDKTRKDAENQWLMMDWLKVPKIRPGRFVLGFKWD